MWANLEKSSHTLLLKSMIVVVKVIIYHYYYYYYFYHHCYYHFHYILYGFCKFKPLLQHVCWSFSIIHPLYVHELTQCYVGHQPPFFLQEKLGKSHGLPTYEVAQRVRYGKMFSPTN